MKRGELFWVRRLRGDPKPARVFVVVCRQLRRGLFSLENARLTDYVG